MFAKSIVLELIQDETPVIYLPEYIGDETTADLKTFLIGLEAATKRVQAEILDRLYMQQVTHSDEIDEDE